MYSLISNITKNAVKRITLTATQKTAATVAAKVAVSTATTVGAMAVNSAIQNKGADKVAKKAAQSVKDHAENPEVAVMTEEQITAEGKKIKTKANVASGAVIGVGSVAHTAIDLAIKAL